MCDTDEAPAIVTLRSREYRPTSIRLPDIILTTSTISCVAPMFFKFVRPVSSVCSNCVMLFSEKLPSAKTPILPSSSRWNSDTPRLPLIGLAGVRPGGSAMSCGGVVSSMTFNACFCASSDEMGAIWRKMDTGLALRERNEGDAELRSMPLVPETATQLFSRNEAESVQGTAVVPMRER